MKQRNIAMSIIFSILTCGIYSIIWLWCLNNELRVANNKTLNSGTNFLLSIITCGIFEFVWLCLLGREIEDVGGKDNGVLYLLLSIFLTPIAGLAFVQYDVNQLCQKAN